ncbi:HNH endonuclease [Luteimonas sp. RIT-PG2_3]
MEPDRATLRLIRTGASTHRDPAVVPDAHAARSLPARLDAVRLLSLDAHGRALNWISWQDASCLYVRGAVAWTLGDPCLQVHGGTRRDTGLQSVLELHPIIASRSHVHPRAMDPTPALTNAALFARDQSLCLYCGRDFSRQMLTRDHVVPLSRGGQDTWENVVSACFHCNSRKGGRTPQQASMPLLAVPYRPSWIEHLILSNRNILADQMAFLTSHLPKHPPRARRTA